eukprot:c8115_g1_i1 orf=475-942(+)
MGLLAEVSPLFTGYVKHVLSEHSLSLYQKMKEDISVCRDGQTFIAVLKVCAKLKDVKRGQTIHAEIVKKGLHERDPFVGSTLISMYSECGWMGKAQEVFDVVLVQDTVLWNALIAGYAKHRRGREALNQYEKMQHDSVPANAVTYICILKACGSI